MTTTNNQIITINNIPILSTNGQNNFGINNITITINNYATYTPLLIDGIGTISINYNICYCQTNENIYDILFINHCKIAYKFSKFLNINLYLKKYKNTIVCHCNYGDKSNYNKVIKIIKYLYLKNLIFINRNIFV